MLAPSSHATKDSGKAQTTSWVGRARREDGSVCELLPIKLLASQLARVLYLYEGGVCTRCYWKGVWRWAIGGRAVYQSGRRRRAAAHLALLHEGRGIHRRPVSLSLRLSDNSPPRQPPRQPPSSQFQFSSKSLGERIDVREIGRCCTTTDEPCGSKSKNTLGSMTWA